MLAEKWYGGMPYFKYEAEIMQFVHSIIKLVEMRKCTHNCFVAVAYLRSQSLTGRCQKLMDESNPSSCQLTLRLQFDLFFSHLLIAIHNCTIFPIVFLVYKNCSTEKLSSNNLLLLFTVAVARRRIQSDAHYSNSNFKFSQAISFFSINTILENVEKCEQHTNTRRFDRIGFWSEVKCVENG